MPILPLDHPEPFAATLGVMLYPAMDEGDPPKARAYAAQYLARAFRRFQESGGTPPYDVLAPILMDADQPLSDLQERWWGGRATGETFKTFFALANTDPALASWEHAVMIVKLTAKRFNVKGARTKLLQARDRFLPVALLRRPRPGGKQHARGAPVVAAEDERVVEYVLLLARIRDPPGFRVALRHSAAKQPLRSP
jgi:hypothetical protein